MPKHYPQDFRSHHSAQTPFPPQGEAFVENVDTDQMEFNSSGILMKYNKTTNIIMKYGSPITERMRRKEIMREKVKEIWRRRK